MDRCCPDSALSKAGNVLGILTFALAAGAYYLAFMATTKGAPAEIVTFARELSTTQNQIVPVIEYFELQHRQANPAYLGHGQSILEALRSLINTLETTAEALNHYNPRPQNSVGMWRRLRWVIDRHDMLGCMARIENQKTNIAASQLSFLLEKSATQESTLEAQGRILSQILMLLNRDESSS